MKLTKNAVRGLTLPAGKSDHLIFDDEVAGFGVRLRAGAKGTRASWVIQYRTPAGQRRMVLGDLAKLDADKARKAAKERLAKVTLGGDPQAEKTAERNRAAEKLGAIIDEYVKAKEPELREASFREMKRYLQVYAKPLHHLPVHHVTRRDIATRLTSIANDHGPIAGARARAALSALFGWGMRRGICESNPCLGTEKPIETPRNRVLSDAELREVWMTTSTDDDYGRILRLLILTGQRRDEVAGMAWSELDADKGAWTLPAARAKNHRAHTITLPASAWAIIDTVSKRANRDLLFGDREGPFQGFGKAKNALDQRIHRARLEAAAKACEPADKVKQMPPWTVHDIRRSVATGMHEIGILPHIVEATLNHVSGHKAGVAGIYNYAKYEREVTAALALWADHVRAIVEGGERKVIPLRSA